MKIQFGRRLYKSNKFRWFYNPMSKQTMKKYGFIIFWWIGYNWYFTLVKGN